MCIRDGGRGHAHWVGRVLSVQGAVSAFEGNGFGGGWDGAGTVEMSDEVVAEGVVVGYGPTLGSK